MRGLGKESRSEIAIPAVAREVPEDLEDIVVTGSRIRQRLGDAPVSVVVLNPVAWGRRSCCCSARACPSPQDPAGRTAFADRRV